MRKTPEMLAATEAQAELTEPAPAATVVEQWFADTFHNRGYDTAEQNRLTRAKEDLIGRLAALTTKE